MGTIVKTYRVSHRMWHLCFFTSNASTVRLQLVHLFREWHLDLLSTVRVPTCACVHALREKGTRCNRERKQTAICACGVHATQIYSKPRHGFSKWSRGMNFDFHILSQSLPGFVCALRAGVYLSISHAACHQTQCELGPKSLYSTTGSLHGLKLICRAALLVSKTLSS